MTRPRRLLLGLAAAAALALPAPALGAAYPVRPGGVHSISSTHFTVWYDSDSTQPDYITETQAGDLAAMAERAYATETGWGYSPPVDDGNGMIDVYVIDGSSWPGVAAVAIPDGAAAPSSGSIDFFKSQIDTTWEQHTIAHELFHLIQFRLWVPATRADNWLLEGSAEWAGYKADAYANGVSTSIGTPDISLDCFDDIQNFHKCSADGYQDGGYSRWTFYEYAAQRYGILFARDAVTQAQATGSALAGLQAAIAAHGGTLPDVFNDWVVKQMTGGWGIADLDSLTPVGWGTPILTGVKSGDIPAFKVSVDDLAARFVQFDRGDGSGSGDKTCFPAQLTLTVTLPAGVAARPYFFWNAKGSTPVALSVSGSTATTTLPWDTCAWPYHGYLSLANPSTTLDAVDFVVSGKLTVDTSTPVNPSEPPPPVPVSGTVVPVPSADVAPTIDVFGPEVLRLSATAKTIRLIVESSGDGVVNAALGSVVLGSGSVRAGNNDLRFTVPASLLASLRRSAGASNVLTLTPLSSTGAVAGTAVTRLVSIAPAVKAKPKAKAKPKPKKLRPRR